MIVDYQNDFNPGGALAVPEGDRIAAHINSLAADPRFDVVVATRDWHPPGHGSFTEQGGVWPVHCLQDSDGAELAPGLDRAGIDVVVDKGQDPGTDGYSGFDGTNLAELLRERGIDSLTVVGLATDYCVKHTAIEAAGEGFGVRVERAGVRGVDVEAGDSERAIEEMRAAGVEIS